MKNKLVLLTALYFLGTTAHAAPAGYDKLFAQAQQAYDSERYRVAATYWQKALKLLADANDSKATADTLTRIADALAKQGKYDDASAKLQQALNLYTPLGGISADFAKVHSDVAAVYRPVPVAELGDSSAKTLTEHSAAVGLTKAEAGAKGHITTPARFVTPLNNDTVDQLGLDRLVTFDVAQDSNGNMLLSNIEGCKIHVVEQNLWVNLLNLVIKQPDEQGKYDAEITAGRVGFAKVMQSKLSPKVVAPVAALVKATGNFSAPATLSLPILP